MICELRIINHLNFRYSYVDIQSDDKVYAPSLPKNVSNKLFPYFNWLRICSRVQKRRMFSNSLKADAFFVWKAVFMWLPLGGSWDTGLRTGVVLILRVMGNSFLTHFLVTLVGSISHAVFNVQ